MSISNHLHIAVLASQTDRSGILGQRNNLRRYLTFGDDGTFIPLGQPSIAEVAGNNG
ncbi:hypothetical protein ADIMK_2889 [Marinobacterium lacunae]|uniref:Uncharacterized protein n=1 Tax=Marinobacterium lacunae TaxID=1232683 RepID=A0A081FWL4_9GAMM|nr:hypothetical protein ADIMK_2889 [Marinobacterium lacunae]